ncbi:MAG: hypothetical protein KGM47_13040, partial [Acidobacteriota bacterium]|nr:hypothetical protein [Acidobacteriota bacterium]
ALNVAKILDDTTWQNRATGWLGILDFVNGNGAGARKKVTGALTECALRHDIGGEDVFLTYLSDGLTRDGMPSKGLAAANKALAIMRTNPDSPYPYRADVAKIAALTELKRYGEARSLIATALNHARQSGILGAEADLLREARPILLESVRWTRFWQSRASRSRRLSSPCSPWELRFP